MGLAFLEGNVFTQLPRQATDSMRPLAACTTVRRALAYQSPVVANVARHNRMPLNPLAIPFVHSSKPTTASARQLHPSNSRPQAAASGGVDSGEDHGTPAPKGPPPVFCDLDGVLTDFDKAVVKALGTTPGKLRIRALWSGAEAADGFCESHQLHIYRGNVEFQKIRFVKSLPLS